MVCKITRLSKAVSLSFAAQEDFIEEIISRMAIKGNRVTGEISNPQIVKQGLEILLSICMAYSNPKGFIEAHNLGPLFVQLKSSAQMKNLVIIEEIAGALLDICNSTI